jgi:uncharacterized protein
MELLRPKSDDTIAVIVKLAGDACNINCYYCYEKRKPYGDERSWIEPQTIARFLESCGQRPLRIVLHGGEPLLVGKARMRRILPVLSGYRGTIELGMQTNGLLLDQEWLDLFDDLSPEIDIAVSLDGDREANAFRVDYRDRSTFDRTIRAIELLASSCRPVGLATTVTSLLLGRESDLMALLRELPHVRSVRLSPCLDYDVTTRKFPVANAASLMILNGTGRGAAGWATSPMDYARFVAGCFDIWRERDFDRFLLEPIFSLLLRLTGGEPATTDWTDQKEQFVVTLYPDGRVGSSDEISTPDSHLGTVGEFESLDDLLRMDSNAGLRRAMQRELNACRSCSHTDTCFGGSLADRMRLAGTPWEQEYCDSRRWLIDYVRRVVAS